MKMFRFNLGTKIASVSIIIVLFTVALLTSIVIRRQSQDLRQQIIEKGLLFGELADTDIYNIYTSISIVDNTEKLKLLKEFAGSISGDILNISIIAPNGKYMFDYDLKLIGEVIEDQFILDALQKRQKVYRTTTYQDEEVIEVVAPHIERDFYTGGVRILFSLHALTQATYGIVKTNTIVGGLLVVLASFFTIIVVYFLNKPIKKLHAATRKISYGDFTVSVNVRPDDEIGDLAASFNAMTETIKRSFEKIQQQNDALAEERNLLRTIIDHMPDFIYVKDVESRYLIANEAILRAVGATEEEIAGKTDFDLFSFEEVKQFYANERKVLESGHPLINQEEGTRDVTTGDRRWLLTTKVPIRDSQGNITGLVGISRDITERKQAEEELKKHRDHLEETVKERTADLLTANKELEDTLKHLKKTQVQLIESEKMAVLGQFVAGVAHEISTPLGAIRASIGNILNALKQVLQNLPELLQQLSSEHQTTFFALIDRAFQERKHLSTREKRKLRRTLKQELEAYSIDGAYNIADTLVDMGIYEGIDPFVPFFQDKQHSTILQAAHNFCIQHHHSMNIMMAMEQASKILSALKNYARYDHSGQKTEANITDGIDVVLTLYHNQLKYGIDVIKHYEEVPIIPCYPDELHQVWTNLFHNAIQAMRGEGTLEITVASGQPPVDGDRYIVVQITDSGCGIPDEIKDRIFDPFFTTKPAGEGNGLGLDIVHKIIDKHQGKIEFESQPGKTTFSVFLPIVT